MHDAEIAAKLLNRWQRNDGPGGAVQQAVDLLREGGLAFKHYFGVSPDTSDEFIDGVEIECLTFDDGSRVLRLNPRGAVSHSIGWAAVAPLLHHAEEAGHETPPA
ncbi:hypothetical protein AWB74_04244 [Caballeronia arvi]|uniref:Uncharacterized protein n=1 Tax=Caballeronia arvi TaxID=1777135 RepID=A0A158JRZ8_9BURK|nr:hypothetical protein [Caballeronia arvi]SAL71704.1 hypothetical protein AWB74_04244 [Caballeronia arvi]